MEYTIGTKVFGDWTIVRTVGEGATGKVFEIQKTDFGVTAKSALKVIRVPRSADDIKAALSEGMDEQSVTSYFQGFVEEIVKEIALMTEIKSHPAVVNYEDHKIIAHEGDIGWDILIRMELLTPLLDYQLKHEFSEAEVLRMGRELCGALAFCQKKGMIHRDIKPENIFVSEIGQFKLGDFGVARTVEKTTGGLSKKGTESYMAPEVYLGRPYGSSVDIYSLGLVLYKFLNGNRLPFYPAPPKPIGFADRENALASRMRGEALPAPSEAGEDFAKVILKACAFDPKERYRSAAEMLGALKKVRVKESPEIAGNADAVPGQEEDVPVEEDTIGMDFGLKEAGENVPEEAEAPGDAAESVPGEEKTIGMDFGLKEAEENVPKEAEASGDAEESVSGEEKTIGMDFSLKGAEENVPEEAETPGDAAESAPGEEKTIGMDFGLKGAGGKSGSFGPQGETASPSDSAYMDPAGEMSGNVDGDNAGNGVAGSFDDGGAGSGVPAGLDGGRSGGNEGYGGAGNGAGSENSGGAGNGAGNENPGGTGTIAGARGGNAGGSGADAGGSASRASASRKGLRISFLIVGQAICLVIGIYCGIALFGGRKDSGNSGSAGPQSLAGAAAGESSGAAAEGTSGAAAGETAGESADPAVMSEAERTMDGWLTQFDGLSDSQIRELIQGENEGYADAAAEWERMKPQLGDYEGLEEAYAALNGVYTGYADYSKAGLVKVTHDTSREGSSILWEPVSEKPQPPELSERDAQMAASWKSVYDRVMESLDKQDFSYRTGTVEDAAEYWKRMGLSFRNVENNYYDEPVYYPVTYYDSKNTLVFDGVSVNGTARYTNPDGSESFCGYASAHKRNDYIIYSWSDYVPDDAGEEERRAAEMMTKIVPYPDGVDCSTSPEKLPNALGITEEMLNWLTEPGKTRVRTWYTESSTGARNEAGTSNVLSLENGESTIEWRMWDGTMSLRFIRYVPEGYYRYDLYAYGENSGGDVQIDYSIYGNRAVPKFFGNLEDDEEDDKEAEPFWVTPDMVRVTVENGSGAYWYVPGTRVEVSSEARLEEDLDLSGWSADTALTFTPVSLTNAMFTVPDRDVTVTAQYEPTTMPDDWEALADRLAGLEKDFYSEASLEELGEYLQGLGFEFADDELEYHDEYQIREYGSGTYQYRYLKARNRPEGGNVRVEVTDYYDDGERSQRSWSISATGDNFPSFPFDELPFGQSRQKVWEWLGLTPEMMEWARGGRAWGDMRVSVDGENNFSIGYQKTENGWYARSISVSGLKNENCLSDFSLTIY